MRYNGMPKGMYFMVMYLSDFNLIDPGNTTESEALIFTHKSKPNYLVIAKQTLLFDLPYKKVKKIAKTHLKQKYGTR